MKITIFPNANPFPTQETKYKESTKAINGEVIELNNLEDLAKIIGKYAWSPTIFDGNRKASNFVSIELITLDIDDSMTIQEANSILKYLRWSYILATTINHQKEKNGVVCDRFRIILPVENIITNINDFKSTWDSITKYFPADPTCRDISRFYFGCIKGVIYENRPLVITKNPIKSKTKKKKSFMGIYTKHGKLSYRTETFLTSKGNIKNWHIEFLYAARDMKAQGYTYEESYKRLSEITGYLDKKHDIHQLDYVYNDDTIKFEYREDIE